MNFLITGAWNNAFRYLEQIEQWGHTAVFMQYEKEMLPCFYDWVEGIICNGLFLFHPIEKFVNLKYIQLTSAGFDRVPMKYVQEQGIEIHNARGVYSIPMAESAVGGVLQLYRKSLFFYENQKQHIWKKHRELQELYGKRVCIMGCGSVGTECAKRFKAFGCEVLGIDLNPGENVHFSKMAGLDCLDSILPETDILILALPLVEETIHLINDRRLALLKDGSILVNISRGAVVDMQALNHELGRLGGAVLDVFEEEPLEESSPLWDMEHVVITPHNSFMGEHNSRRLDVLIMDTIRRKKKKE